MNAKSLKFHIKENDFFGTIATVIDLVSQDLRKNGQNRNAEILQRLRDNLVDLQHSHRIEKLGRTHQTRLTA